MLPGMEIDYYVIDCCAIIDLELANRDILPGLDSNARERIWSGLEALIKQGRLVTVQQSRAELERHCPTALARLKRYKRRFFLANTVELYTTVMEVFRVWPQQARKTETLQPNREPADPYLIALAYLRGHVLVTSEKPRSLRTPSNRSGLRIPDICDLMQPPVRCYSMAKLIATEQL
jgi:hypothetical protein